MKVNEVGDGMQSGEYLLKMKLLRENRKIYISIALLTQ
jgi:hypothetical protein